MAQFSNDMRNVAKDLIKKFGDDCVLTKVSKNGAYDPSTGETTKTKQDFPTYSSTSNEVNKFFTPLQNANLLAFNDKRVLVAWFGEEIDSTWLYNGQNITTVIPTTTQNDVIMYSISVGEKE